MKNNSFLVRLGRNGINGALAWGIAGFVGGLNLASLGLDLPVGTFVHLLLSTAVPGAVGAGVGIATSSFQRKQATEPDTLFHPFAFILASAQVCLLMLAAWLAYGQTPRGWVLAIAAVLAATLVPRIRRVHSPRFLAWVFSLAGWWIVVSLWVQAGIPWRPGHHRPAEAGEMEPSVLLLTLDTVGARHLGCYGGPEGLTPRIDALAADGVVFDRALATAPYTLPSLTSMASGLVPSRHGVRGNPWPLPDDVLLLGDYLSLTGIELAAGTDLAIPAGLERGFDHILTSTPRELPPLRRLLRRWKSYGGWFDTDDSSIPLTLAARRWLFEKNAEPGWLLWVHYFDDAPHAPYRSPEPYRGNFVDPQYTGPASGEIEQLLAWSVTDGASSPSPRDREHTVDLYQAELAWLDAQVGVLLDALQRTGAYDQSWVILSADHGEQFGRDGVFQHGKSLRSEVLHVPLIVKPPGTGQPWKGRRIPHLVSVTDIFPTVLEACGLSLPSNIDGRSLVPWIETDQPKKSAVPRVVISETPAVASPSLMATTDQPFGFAASTESGLRLIYAPETGTSLLFDLTADPNEEHDLAPSDPFTTKLLRERARRHLGVDSLESLVPVPAATPHDPETLQSFGYVP